MNCIKYFLRYFYYEESRSSKCQLRNDFGCFPPKPINSKDFGSDFVVAKFRGLGCIYPYILLAKRLWQTKDFSEVPEAFVDCWKAIRCIKDGLIASRKNIINITNTIGGKVLLPFLFIIMSPIMVAKFVKLIFVVIKHGYRMQKQLGYFNPFFNDKNRVMINVGRSKNEALEVVVTHEHIHMLQNINKEISCKNSRCGEILLGDEWQSDIHILYLLEKDELEARLHEIVISYYRKNNRLPVTTNGFIELLSNSTQFGRLVTKSMGLKPSTEGQSFVKCYEERSKVVAMEIELILACIKDDNLRRQFINEVLTVMYGKLIKYYGDENLSSNFLKCINRPNLYDRLYIRQQGDLIVH